MSGQFGKKIQVQTGGKLDIYIALDVSDSIDQDDFEKAKEVIKTLIEKVYEINSVLITIISTDWFNSSIFLPNYVPLVYLCTMHVNVMCYIFNVTTHE